MKLLVGLGNPGEKYANTRHNAGFMFIDYLEKNVDHTTILLAKPQTFMNKSGRAVNELLKKNNIAVEDLIVVHDDLDIQLGNFKIQKGTGPKVHNGLSSIESTLRRNDFLRIRIGIDNRKGDFRIPGETYVLQNFTADEKKILEELFPKILERLILTFL